MSQLKFVLMVAAIALAAACGGGGGDGGKTLPPIAADGYPDVNGTYAVSYSSTPANCSNGESANTNSISTSYVITRTGSSLDGTGGFLPRGDITILSSQDNGCVIRTDAAFACSGGVRYTKSGVAGAITANYSTTGQFHATGFEATYSITYILEAYGVSCSAAIPVTGERF